MQKGEELRFKYSALFQSIEIRIFNSSESSGHRRISCEADLKLPILKKKFKTESEYAEQDLNWILHTPTHEYGTTSHQVLKTAENAQALDPIGFFIKLHRGEWENNEVQLLIGKKIVFLDVVQLSDGYEIRRKDKDQKLIVRKDLKGICALELPLPVLGTISLKRV